MVTALQKTRVMKLVLILMFMLNITGTHGWTLGGRIIVPM